MRRFYLFFSVLLLVGSVCQGSPASRGPQQLCLVPSGKIELPEQRGGIPSAGVFQSVDYWMGLYYGKTKIGYMHVKTVRDKFEGKNVFKRQGFVHHRLKNGSRIYGFDVTHTCYVSDESRPVADLVKISNVGYRNGDTTGNIEFLYGSDAVTMKMAAGDTKNEMTAKMTEDDWPPLILGARYGLGALDLSIGDTAEVKRVDVGRLSCTGKPSEEGRGLEGSFGCTRSRLEVLRRETVELAGKTYDTIVVKEKWDEAEIIKWQLDSGEVVKAEFPGSELMFIRESKTEADEFDAAEPPDVTSL